MPLHIVPLATALAQQHLFPWLVQTLGPKVQCFLTDPGGALERVGDLLVWNGEKGQTVLAGLESLADNQQRIINVVENIETVQIQAAGILGGLVGFSMLNLGMTAFLGGCMMWRFNSLNKKLTTIGSQLADILAHVRAMAKVPLETSLAFLQAFERTHALNDLHTAKEKSTEAIAFFGDLVAQEIAGQKRLAALHQCGRLYLLSLLTRVRCHVLEEELSPAHMLIVSHIDKLKKLAEAVFQEVLGKSPELYLHPTFEQSGVNYTLLAEIYQQGRRAQAIDKPRMADPSELFEHLRRDLFKTRWFFSFAPKGRLAQSMLVRLKLLMSCLEEINRVQSYQLRIQHAHVNNVPEILDSINPAIGPRDGVFARFLI